MRQIARRSFLALLAGAGAATVCGLGATPAGADTVPELPAALPGGSPDTVTETESAFEPSRGFVRRRRRIIRRRVYYVRPRRRVYVYRRVVVRRRIVYTRPRTVYLRPRRIIVRRVVRRRPRRVYLVRRRPRRLVRVRRLRRR